MPAVRCDDQTRKQVDRAIGSMGAGQPLRIEEGQRTRFHRHGLAHHEQPAIQIRQIDAQGQRAGIKDILRRGDFGRSGGRHAAQAKQRGRDKTFRLKHFVAAFEQTVVGGAYPIYCFYVNHSRVQLACSPPFQRWF